MRRYPALCLLLSALWPIGLVRGATSTAWETTGFAEFLKGRLFGLSLTADGVLTPGPAEQWRVTLGQPALWSTAMAPDGSLYAATGHSGRVFRIDKSGHEKQLWVSEQPEVFAIAVNAQGQVFAGTSPNGGIYRLDEGGGQLLWRSPAKYIWKIVPTSDGLFVATGENGRVYKVDSQGKGDVYYETEQANVTALAAGLHGELYAGTEPNGITYRITAAKTGTVLYDSSLPEVRAIVPQPDGSVYIAAMGGAISTRTANGGTASAAATSGVVTAASPTVITVTEAHGAGENVQSAARTSVTSSVTPAGQQPAGTSTTTVSETSGVEKSAVYRVAPDLTVETLRSSKDDNVYDLVVSDGSLLVATDDRGRVYKMSGTRASLLVEPGDGEATGLIQSGTHLFFALSNPARVIAFDTQARGAGTYQSQIHDSGSIARWGHLQWRCSDGGAPEFQTRTGNSIRPDNTWSAWSTTILNPQQSLISSPIARYVQWKADWKAGTDAGCTSITVPYLPRNEAPVIRSVSVTSVLGTNPAKALASASGASSAYSVTVTDTGEAPAATVAGNSIQTLSKLQTTQTQVSWQADDPDSDKLVYALYFRPEEAKDWQLIRSRMAENSLLLDPDVFADGRYLFRVVASDAPSNAVQYAKQSEMVSAAVLIDNTPPTISIDSKQRNGAVVDISFTASDSTSALKRSEYSIDGGYWQPIEAVDGILDSPAEQFAIHLERLRPGEHLVVLRVYDLAGNAGLARVLVQ